MIDTLRHYQVDVRDKTATAYADGARAVLAVLPTGGGKTWQLADANSDGLDTCTIVHRQELLGQISTTYAEAGIPHRIIAPDKVVRFCIDRMIRKAGRSMHDKHAPTVIAGVDTLIRPARTTASWRAIVRQWSLDEAHHGLGLLLEPEQANKWGKAAQLFPNARGFGVTATPLRADGRSLHMDQGGMFDRLVQGASMRDLMEWGNLCEYRVIAPESSINEAELKMGSTGDWTHNSVEKATKAEITGDVVNTYCRFAPGKQAIVFASSVEKAEEMARAFNAAGHKAVELNGETDDKIRDDAVKAFERGEIRVLINVDLFDEGFDVPAVEVVIMARKTASFGKFCQMIGRALRPAPGKLYGIIIDHVGNVVYHAAKNGMPDTPRKWRLWKDENVKRQDKDPEAVPVRVCGVCTMTYEAVTMVCPYCGMGHQVADRGSPEQVDGMLQEMSPELLERLRMMKAQVWQDAKIPIGASEAVVGARLKHHRILQEAHAELSEVMGFWGGVMNAAGYSDNEMQARFYHRFGIDVMSAQGLKAADAKKLTEAVRNALT